MDEIEFNKFKEILCGITSVLADLAQELKNVSNKQFDLENKVAEIVIVLHDLQKIR